MLGSAEQEAASRVVGSGLLAQGPECEALEEEMGDYLSASHVVVVSSGSAALHLALAALRTEPDHGVGLPSYVCTALLNAVKQVDASPVLTDLTQNGYNIHPADVPEDVSTTIVPHMFGCAADIGQFKGDIIEDCAMAIGASSGSRKLGTLGRLGVFSFYATKVLCAGEGGAVCTDDPDLAEAVRDLRDYDGRSDARIRYNYKMTDIQAAIARIQLSQLDQFVSIRRELAARYNAAFSNTSSILPDFKAEDIPFRYVVRRTGSSANDLITSFEADGIAARRPVFKPLHTYLNQRLPNTERTHSEAVSIPLYPALTEENVKKILEVGRQKL